MKGRENADGKDVSLRKHHRIRGEIGIQVQSSGWISQQRKNPAQLEFELRDLKCNESLVFF